ncbi:MAG: type II toxin-antitoxin system RelE/ParE family toxin [Promethearchaeota archaeon]|nr:MAG: type II toxin-antitoxin system RelE/ParE family toxin [Candidatus Lokiarchaeota archaeon]
MVQIEWSEEAEEDLDDILSYLSKTSSQYANSFFERIYSAIENILAFPKIGRKVPESENPDDREIFLQKYRLIYRFNELENKITVMMIIHGSKLLRF